ncbi:MAG: hypothetical protein HY557_08450 [Euryarchaeota archaeon]|nr:hypothetical protein [Euryarchaeota archaeon]
MTALRALLSIPFVLATVAALSALSDHAAARCFGVPEEIGPAWYVHLNATTADGTRDGAEFGAAKGATEFFDDGLDIYEPDPGDRPISLFLRIGAGEITFVRVNVSVNDDFATTIWPLAFEYRGEGPTRILLEWSAADIALVPDSWTLIIRPVGIGPIDMRVESSVGVLGNPGVTSAWIYGKNVPSAVPPLSSEALAVAVVAYAALVAAALYLRARRRKRGQRDTLIETDRQGGESPRRP